MTVESDRAQFEVLKGAKAQLEADQAGQEATAAAANVAAVLNEEGISVCGGKYILPRITTRTLYLLSRMKSPIATLQAEGESVIVTTDQMIEALFVIMRQNDPRIVSIVADRERLDREIYNLTGQIDIRDIAEIGKAISEQMAGINTAAQEEGLADPKNGAPVPLAG
jgi:uncharacterized protein YdcH (DUF465 family)